MRLESARNVPLRDVRHFVRQHAGEFALIARLEHEARVDADVSAWQGERVDGRIAHDEEIEVAVAVLGEARQPQSQRLDVFMNLRVVEDHAGLAQVAHDHAADLALVLEAERRLGRGPHFGELVLRGLLGLRQRRQR